MQPCVGIDLGKATLHVALGSTGPLHQLRNDPVGHRQLLKLLTTHPGALVLLEAGAYQHDLTRTLHRAGVPLRVESPARIRHFAKADGQLAKTDRIDCRLIARFGEVLSPAPQPPPPPQIEKLVLLEARARQYTDDLSREKLRREHLPAALRRDSRAFIALLERRRAALLDKALGEMENCPDLLRRFKLLCSCKGVKERLALTLVCTLPELGALPDKTLAALTGVAPYARESGRVRWRSRTGGGRAAARGALFMAALVARRWDPELHAFSERLLAQGKRKMVVQVACMHKLLRQMNAVLRRGSPWEARTTT